MAVLKTQILKGVPGSDLGLSSGSGLTIVQLSLRLAGAAGCQDSALGTGAPTWLKNRRHQDIHKAQRWELSPRGRWPMTAPGPNPAHTLF